MLNICFGFVIMFISVTNKDKINLDIILQDIYINLLGSRAARFGFFGRPPSFPFSRDAASLARLLVLPPLLAALRSQSGY